MSEVEMALVVKLADAARRGEILNRDLVSRCYHATISERLNEDPSISEGWIDAIWKRCKEIPAERFVAAAGNRLKLAELGHAIFA